MRKTADDVELPCRGEAEQVYSIVCSCFSWRRSVGDSNRACLFSATALRVGDVDHDKGESESGGRRRTQADGVRGRCDQESLVSNRPGADGGPGAVRQAIGPQGGMAADQLDELADDRRIAVVFDLW